MNRRLLVVGGVLAAGIAAGYLLMRMYDVEFLSMVVERTVEEKLDPSVDAAAVRRMFAGLRADREAGRLTRGACRDGLLEAAAFIEKRQVLRQQDVERIEGYFHPQR